MVMNANHQKFITYRLQGTKRVDAYMKAYDLKNRKTAVSNVSRLMLTNAEVREALQKHQDDALAETKETLALDAPNALDTVMDLRVRGYASDSVKLKAAELELKLAGVEPPKKIEHSGEIGISLLDVLKAGRAKNEGD